MGGEEDKSVSGILLKAVRWMCQPLIRLLIEKGITYPVFCELLKGLYIETAEKHLKDKGVKPTLSRIFVQTGIHRRETKRVLEEVLSGDESAFQVSSLGGLLVSRWLAMPEYQDENGNPRCLPRIGESVEAGFNDLVASVSKDVHPRSILDEWIELGVATLDEGDNVCLNKNAFVPSGGFEEKAFFLGRHIHDHINTCVHNMITEKQSKLERSVYYSALTPQSVEVLQRLANEKAEETLTLLNARAMELKQDDAGQDSARYRIRYGCFWFDSTDKAAGQGEEKS